MYYGWDCSPNRLARLYQHFSGGYQAVFCNYWGTTKKYMCETEEQAENWLDLQRETALQDKREHRIKLSVPT